MSLYFVERRDFYELTGMGTGRVAEILGMVVCKDRNGNNCLAIPAHRFNECADELVEAGYMVCVGTGNDWYCSADNRGYME